MNTPLQDLLKKKGIGPEGSKSLKTEDIDLLTLLLKSPDESLTTKATLLTALLLLDPNPNEKQWIEMVRQMPHHFLPNELFPFVTDIPSHKLQQLTKKIINKEDLNEEECKEGMNYIFDESVPDYLKGPFLEAERLKRETTIENKIFFDFLWNKAKREIIDLPVLIDICDSYDGNARTLQLSPFVAALLASAGFPTYVHSVDHVAPKEGITSHQVLLAGGKNPLNSFDSVVKDLLDPHIGWSYIDQQIYFPELYGLKQIRKEMVKRPFLATFEKLLQPIHIATGNFIVTGYTHPHYKTEVINQLALQKKCAKAINIKGSEGSTGVSLSKDTFGLFFDGGAQNEISFNPGDYNIPLVEYKIKKGITPIECFNEGIAAFNNIDNYVKANIIYLATIIVTTFFKVEYKDAVELFNLKIKSGETLKHWQKGSN